MIRQQSARPVASMNTGTVEANGVRLHGERRGCAAAVPTLVFAHAFGASAQTWRGVVGALGSDALGAVPCVAPDLRGWGASEATGAGYAVADMADGLDALVGALGLERWALVGHSMGQGGAGARRPAGLEALALAAPSPPTPEPMTVAARERLRAAWGAGRCVSRSSAT